MKNKVFLVVVLLMASSVCFSQNNNGDVNKNTNRILYVIYRPGFRTLSTYNIIFNYDDLDSVKALKIKETEQFFPNETRVAFVYPKRYTQFLNAAALFKAFSISHKLETKIYVDESLINNYTDMLAEKKEIKSVKTTTGPNQQTINIYTKTKATQLN